MRRRPLGQTAGAGQSCGGRRFYRRKDNAAQTLANFDAALRDETGLVRLSELKGAGARR